MIVYDYTSHEGKRHGGDVKTGGETWNDRACAILMRPDVWWLYSSMIKIRNKIAKIPFTLLTRGRENIMRKMEIDKKRII